MATQGDVVKKIRFTVADDVAVLMEVTAYGRPFQHGSKAWREIVAKLVHLGVLHAPENPTSHPPASTPSRRTASELIDTASQNIHGCQQNCDRTKPKLTYLIEEHEEDQEEKLNFNNFL